MSDTKDTALLVMDVQQGITGRVEDEGYVPRLARAVEAARGAGVRVIHVVIGFRAGHPEISAANKSFGAMPDGVFTAQDPGSANHPAVVPAEGETVVTKKRVSAFAGSDLDMVLRAGGIRHLVLSGIATSGVVLSTLRQAADLDFRLTVLSDGCYDPDEEVHRVLVEKVFPRQAGITTVDEWSKAPE
ncbi:cysteine hydrolase family protein [Streptomyces sp. NPDC050560]|uniref:cysteine hydrolase family protein n=1 Tax=Streptomyces sp. NPDC050560 TaxID=3365630 RepID=UPI0037A14DB1